jgi:hypothetical protein
MKQLVVMAAILFTLLAVGPATSQPSFPPASFENLQVLPKTSTAGDVIGTMKSFASGLGVRCQFCHIGEEGLPLEQFDFVSDERARKNTARAMMRLVQDINRQIDTAMPPAAGAGARVTCFTCHRGSQSPAKSPGH